MATLEEQLSDVRKDIADKKREIETAKAKLADHPEQQRMVELDQQLLLQMQEEKTLLLKERAASQLFGGYHAGDLPRLVTWLPVVIQLVFWGVLLGVLFHKYLPRTPDGGVDLGWLATIIPFFLLVPEKVINDFRGKGVASWVVVSVWQRLRRQSAVEVAQEGAQQGAQEGAQQGAQEGAQQGAQEGVHGGDAEQGAQSVAQSGNSVATSNELL